MSHDQYLLHFEHLHRKLYCGRNAVLAGLFLTGRDKCGDIADDEDITGIDIEYLSRVHSAVAATDDHQFGMLALGDGFIKTRFLARVGLGAESAIAFQQLGEFGH